MPSIRCDSSLAAHEAFIEAGFAAFAACLTLAACTRRLGLRGGAVPASYVRDAAWAGGRLTSDERALLMRGLSDAINARLVAVASDGTLVLLVNHLFNANPGGAERIRACRAKHGGRTPFDARRIADRSLETVTVTRNASRNASVPIEVDARARAGDPPHSLENDSGVERASGVTATPAEVALLALADVVGAREARRCAARVKRIVRVCPDVSWRKVADDARLYLSRQPRERPFGKYMDALDLFGAFASSDQKALNEARAAEQAQRELDRKAREDRRAARRRARTEESSGPDFTPSGSLAERLAQRKPGGET